jgi:DNA-directed RNA polymerase specialized sigma24 family protein
MATGKDDPEQLLADWRAGRLSREGLYDHCWGALRRGAYRGFRAMMSPPPEADELQEVMVRAFLELEAQDPAGVSSITGFASRIANFRARDFVRERIRDANHNRSVEEDRALQLNLQLAELDGFDSESRGRLGDWAIECVQALPAEQRAVVEATVIGRESLSDWAAHRGKSHQAASRQRERALKAVGRCIAHKRSQPTAGEEDQSYE